MIQKHRARIENGKQAMVRCHPHSLLCTHALSLTQERRAAVRKRIESEKQSLRAAAEERAAKLAGLDVPPPAPGIKGRRVGGDASRE